MKFYLSTGLALLISTVTAIPAQYQSGQGSQTTQQSRCYDSANIYTENGRTKEIFNHCATGATIEMTKNSGICETTPGVNTWSGYISFGPKNDINMFFWYFEARKNAEQAPLGVFLNGGPGCSSMMGLFKENGPCQFYNGSKTPSLNPYSWNNNVNMLYMDQPVGSGFSFSKTNTTLVNSTADAAPPFWTALQAFYGRFPQYKTKDLGLFSQSYGGHYGPAFVKYIQQQNSLIDQNIIRGTKLRIAALGINDGWYDMKITMRSYIEYASRNKYNRFINASDVADLNTIFEKGCGAKLDICARTGTNKDCRAADSFCWNDYVVPYFLDVADFDTYDVRAPYDDPNPPLTYIKWLSQPSVLKAIGAKVPYVECSADVFDPFWNTADETRSSIPDMSAVVASGIPTLMWHGDADFDCNYIAGLNTSHSIKFPGQAAYRAKPLTSYKVKGRDIGEFKAQDNLMFLNVYNAGHELPFYQPQLALQVFNQMMFRKAIWST